MCFGLVVLRPVAPSSTTARALDSRDSRSSYTWTQPRLPLSCSRQQAGQRFPATTANLCTGNPEPRWGNQTFIKTYGIPVGTLRGAEASNGRAIHARRLRAGISALQVNLVEKTQNGVGPLVHLGKSSVFLLHLSHITNPQSLPLGDF